MKVSIYDVIYELNRRGVKVNSLENLTDEALRQLLPDVDLPTQMGNTTLPQYTIGDPTPPEIK